MKIAGKLCKYSSSALCAEGMCDRLVWLLLKSVQLQLHSKPLVQLVGIGFNQFYLSLNRHVTHVTVCFHLMSYLLPRLIFFVEIAILIDLIKISRYLEDIKTW